MSKIRQRLTDDMKQAMRDKAKDKLSTIRMALAAIKQREIDERITLCDNDVITIVSKMIKQRKDSFTQFQDAGRDELAAKEKFEINILQDYLPQALTEDEIKELIQQQISEINAKSIKDMGKVMGGLKAKMLGRADMSKVGALIKNLLNN
jgi:uncharacterized protein YqeY